MTSNQEIEKVLLENGILLRVQLRIKHYKIYTYSIYYLCYLPACQPACMTVRIFLIVGSMIITLSFILLPASSSAAGKSWIFTKQLNKEVILAIFLERKIVKRLINQ